MRQSTYLGLDIGGSSVKFGWGDSKKGLQHFDRIILKDNTIESLFKAVNNIKDVVHSTIGFDSIMAIGIGTPGTYDIESGEIKGINPNLPELTNLNPKCMFSQEMEPYVFVDNDANLMALAESLHFHKHKYVLGITIGSGIGCGYVINKQIYHGAHGYAMELGHTIVKINGRKCNCGKYGCLEAYSSVNGLINQMIKINPLLSLNDMNDILVSSREDTHTLKLLDDSLHYLSVAIDNLIINLDVELVVIGGGSVELDNYPFAQLKKLILDGLPEINKNKIRVARAFNGNKAGVIGAISIAEVGYKSI